MDGGSVEGVNAPPPAYYETRDAFQLYMEKYEATEHGMAMRVCPCSRPQPTVVREGVNGQREVRGERMRGLDGSRFFG